MSGTSLAVDIAGIKLANPVIVASGTIGYGREFSRIQDFDHQAPGAIVLKTVTLDPWEGNPPPRIAETPSGMLNSIGLQNPGVREFVRHVLPGLRGYGPKVIANIAGHSLHEYALVAGEISAAPDADVLSAIEVNISCPNVHKGGMAFGSHPETADLVISGVRKATTLPIIAKLTPVAADIAEVAKACIEAGANALSLINTLPGMVIDTRTRRPLLGHRTGGLSGPAIRPVAVLMVHRVYQVAKRTGIPVIGMGGISNADDALQFILAGASAVGVGTALFWNYSVCREIVDGLRQRLEQEGVSSVAELVGAMRE